MKKNCKLFMMTFILLMIFSVFNVSKVSAYTYNFRAYIDGESELLIRDNTVQWHNLQWDVPGITSDEDETGYTNYPTTITTADMGTVSWYPSWEDTFGDQYSSIFENLNQVLASGGSIALTVIEKRDEGNVFISQLPDINNSYTLIVNFDDAGPSGAAWYEIQLNTGNPVPVPAAVWLLGSGLIGLIGFRRRKHQ